MRKEPRQNVDFSAMPGIQALALDRVYGINRIQESIYAALSHLRYTTGVSKAYAKWQWEVADTQMIETLNKVIWGLWGDVAALDQFYERIVFLSIPHVVVAGDGKLDEGYEKQAQLCWASFIIGKDISDRERWQRFLHYHHFDNGVGAALDAYFRLVNNVAARSPDYLKKIAYEKKAAIARLYTEATESYDKIHDLWRMFKYTEDNQSPLLTRLMEYGDSPVYDSELSPEDRVLMLSYERQGWARKVGPQKHRTYADSWEPTVKAINAYKTKVAEKLRAPETDTPENYTWFVNVKYLKPGPAGPLKGSGIVRSATKPEKGDVYYSQFGVVEVVTRRKATVIDTSKQNYNEKLKKNYRDVTPAVGWENSF